MDAPRTIDHSRFPFITYLNGSRHVGKMALARSLQELDSGICIIDMNDPLREALFHLCYSLDEQLDPTIDWASKEFLEKVLPGTMVPNLQIIQRLERFCLDNFGPTFFGRRAIDAINTNAPMFDSFVIVNATREMDVDTIYESFPDMYQVLLRIRPNEPEAPYPYVYPRHFPSSDLVSFPDEPQRLVVETLRALTGKANV